MPSAYRPTGLLAPVITPFAADGRVDLDALEQLSAELLDAGATALIALSTTAEPSALDSAERDAVVAACARVCADRDAELVVGAGTNDTRTTIERHEALASVPSVVASLAVVPYYVRPSEAGILGHFEAVAERSPVPLITYNVPYRTGRGLGAAALLELAAIENIAGVKQAVASLDADTLALLAAKPEGFAVLGGDDAYLFPTMLMGGEGAIAASGHLCTERVVATSPAAPARRGAPTARGGALRRAEPRGDQGAAARRGPDRDARRTAAADAGDAGGAAAGTGGAGGRAQLVRTQGPAAMRAGRALLVAPRVPQAQAAVADVTHVRVIGAFDRR